MNGRVVHFEVPAKGLKRARAFYSDVFGWKMTEIPETNYTIVGTTAVGKDGRPTEPGAINGGMTKRAHLVESPIITIEVDEVQKTSMGEIGFFGYFKDTEGNMIGPFRSDLEPMPLLCL